MVKIICNITPFIYTQIFYILEENTNETLETVSFTNENLLEKINYILTKYKKIKDINVKEEVNNALIDTDTQIKELVTQTQMVVQENQALRKKQNQLIEALTQIEVKDDDTVHKEM